MTRFRLAYGLLGIILLVGFVLTSAQSVTIELKHRSDVERRTKEQLERLLSTYNLGKIHLHA